MGTLRFRVSEADAGARLDRVLAGRAEIGSRALAERLLAVGAVRVEGTPRPKSHRVEAGALVELELPEEDAPLAPEAVTVPVAWEDEHLLVVDKPAGLSVHPGAGERRGTLAGQLLALGAAGGDDPARPGIVHRLDRDTSGLLVVARSQEAYAALADAIRKREVERRYLALVRGRPRSRTGRIDAAIGRDRRDPTRRSLDTDEPREAVTHFEALELLPEHALLEVRLETGRTHQIRVHLAAIDLPVAGDAQYGVRGDLGLARQFLHAHRLRFRHPLTGAEVDVSSPLPPDLEAALERARGRRSERPGGPGG
ncbi:MAG TPA: RluA family pseudouridine synthase [Gaiellaceae bacterium]|nr:RluA family pseudouridine synthase [Gaiellaceae bacterium]